MTLPATVADFTARRPQFEAWLLANGSAIEAPTSPYEVMRFLGDAGKAVIFRNDADRITSWINGADRIFGNFAGGKEWRATPRGRRERSNKRTRLIASLVLRDGWSCLFCGRMTTGETATIEHVVSLTHKGPDHLANMALAHRECNCAASHLSAREKFEMALRLRGGVMIHTTEEPTQCPSN